MNKQEARWCSHCDHLFDPIRYKQHLRNVVNSMARDKNQRKILERWYRRMTKGIED